MDIANKVMDSVEIFVAKLREEYEGLGLTDRQIIQCANLGISCEQVKKIKEELFKYENDYDKILEAISLFKVGMDKNDLAELKEIGTIRRNKKGKRIKSWEKNNFYE